MDQKFFRLCHAAQPQDEQIYVIKGLQASASNFTGDVTIARIFPSGDQLKLSGGYVAFQPGAGTNWHVHPNGQMIIIAEGAGRVQQ